MFRIASELYRFRSATTRDVDWTYQVYVLLNPPENFSLVQQSNIKVTICLDFFASQKTLDTNTIVESDNDDVVASSVDQTVTIKVPVGERVKSTTLEVDKNRMRCRSHRRCKDIESKAIFGMIWVVAC